jgi:hypothetical protein
LANFAIISSADNKTLGGKAPSVYRSKMPEERTPEILRRAICPTNLFDDDYDAFLDARTAILAAYARELAEVNPA